MLINSPSFLLVTPSLSAGKSRLCAKEGLFFYDAKTQNEHMAHIYIYILFDHPPFFRHRGHGVTIPHLDAAHTHIPRRPGGLKAPGSRQEPLWLQIRKPVDVKEYSLTSKTT